MAGTVDGEGGVSVKYVTSVSEWSLPQAAIACFDEVPLRNYLVPITYCPPDVIEPGQVPIGSVKITKEPA